MTEKRFTIASKENEMMVLGCALSNADAGNLVCTALDRDHFFFPEHKEIFAAIKHLHSNEMRVDVHLACENEK